MSKDPVLEEAWRIKDEQAARSGGDIRRLARELKEDEEKGERKVVSFEPERAPARPSRGVKDKGGRP